MKKKTLLFLLILGVCLTMFWTKAKENDLTNLALNRKYSASSSENEGSASELKADYAFDGNNNTRWSSVFKDVKDAFIEVDFEEFITINSVSILECKQWSHVVEFRIDVANKEGQWDTVYKGGRIHDNRFIYFDAIETNKLRLVFAASEGNSEDFLTVTLYEVRVYYDENPTPVDESWIEFPFVAPDEKYEADYIFLIGGYHSIDNGCPAWGSADYSEIRFIGDKMGDLKIVYNDNSEDIVPLVFGYTMWFKNNFADGGAPFKTEAKDENLTKILKETLHLYGAFESEDKCVVRIKPQNKGIKEIRLIDNKDKAGYPMFDGAYLLKGENVKLKGGPIEVDPALAFFKDHTLDSTNPYPKEVEDKINLINRALLTYEEDYKDVSQYVFGEDYKGAKIRFSGNSFAEIATGVIAENIMNLTRRVDDDGMMHTSYKDAPSWRYDGFGTYVPKANQYFTDFYSRDGARAIMSLNSYGHIDVANRAALFANNAMMYFRNEGLTIGGKQIPGHYTVIVNKPLVYSTVLTGVGWPTQYTKQRFGKEYQNMGNQETDGHGLMMLANYNIWRNKGKDKNWVESNYTQLKEACDFILWAFDNPTLSFARNGLLYAESEAGMGAYTLYCNLPCYMGLRGYAKMANQIGHTDDAKAWNACADIMEEAISKSFASKEAWQVSKFGFYHDPALTMMSDVYGFDLNDMPQEWVLYSKNVYEEDIKNIRKQGHYGPVGIGYDHAMISQSALLIDNMEDANKLVSNLTRLSYSPRLPEKYLVPEGISVDFEKGIIRRQGDLGNLVQLAEALKVYHIVVGISPVLDSTLKILPRLPKDWKLDVEDYDLQNAEGKMNFQIDYPTDGYQNAKVSFIDAQLESVKVRFGPFPLTTESAKFRVNGEEKSCDLIVEGDSKWAWLELDSTKKDHNINLVFSDSDQLPDWPIADKVTQKGNLAKYLLLALPVLAIGLALPFFLKKKKEK